jgi:hypothetical protein
MTKSTSLLLIHFSFYTIFLLLFSHANSKLNAKEQAILLNLKQHWQNPQPLRHSTHSLFVHSWLPPVFSFTCDIKY